MNHPAQLPAKRARLPYEAWFTQYGGPDLQVTPLFKARVAARRRSWWIQMSGAALAFLCIGGQTGWTIANHRPPPLELALAVLAGAYLVPQAGALAAAWYEDRADRRVAESMHLPLTQIPEVDAHALVGRGYGATIFGIYFGGFTFGVLGAVSDLPTQDRILAAGFALGLVMFSAYGTARLAQLSRRQPIGADERSLRTDDLVRRFDAYRIRSLLLMAPLLLAVAVETAGTIDSVLLGMFWVFAGVAFVGVLAGPHHGKRSQVQTPPTTGA